MNVGQSHMWQPQVEIKHSAVYLDHITVFESAVTQNFCYG